MRGMVHLEEFHDLFAFHPRKIKVQGAYSRDRTLQRRREWRFALGHHQQWTWCLHRGFSLLLGHGDVQTRKHLRWFF